MTSTHDRRFARIERASAVPSIVTMSDTVVFMGFSCAFEEIAPAAAAPAASVRNARRFRSVGSFIADLFFTACYAPTVLRSHIEGPLPGKPLNGSEWRLLAACCLIRLPGPAIRLPLTRTGKSDPKGTVA